MFECHGPVNVGGAAVALQLNGYHPVGRGQHRDRGSEAELDGQQTPVQQDERRPVTVLLVSRGALR